MPSQGPLYSSNCVDDASVGTATWGSPSAAQGPPDASPAGALLGAGQQTHYLKASNFGFTIPGGSTITSILVEWHAQCVNGNITTTSARLVTATLGITGTNQSGSTGVWATSYTYQAYGGSTTWGLSLTDADVNSTLFGAVLSVTASSGDSAYVDAVRITISYGTPSGQAGSAVSVSSVTAVATTSVATPVIGNILTPGLGPVGIVVPLGLKASAAVTVSAAGSSVSVSTGTGIAPTTVSAAGSSVSISRASMPAAPPVSVPAQAVAMSVATAEGAVFSGGGGGGGGTGTYNLMTGCGVLGRYRNKTRFDGFMVWVGVGALPDMSLPGSFTTTLPLAIATAPPVAGTQDYYVIVRKINAYGLQSQNQQATIVTVDAAGNMQAGPVGPLIGFQLALLFGDKIRVLSTYPEFTTVTNPADRWRVWISTAVINTATDAPAFDLEASKILVATTGAMLAGTYNVTTAMYRSGDGKYGPFLSGTIVVPPAPGSVIPVIGGYEQ